MKAKFQRFTSLFLCCSLLFSGICPHLAQGALERTGVTVVDEDDELEFPPLAEGRGRVGVGIEVEGFLDYQSDYYAFIQIYSVHS
ncbi:MAG: hypothetical protein LBI29_01060 [Rickettsiales bacterium]|nr:hypothetical protein [Rickettsiales bacterium]